MYIGKGHERLPTSGGRKEEDEEEHEKGAQDRCQDGLTLSPSWRGGGGGSIPEGQHRGWIGQM